MCKTCGRRFCVPPCPNYEGAAAGCGRAVHKCLLCGRSIYNGEKFYTDGESVVCEDCAVHMDIRELRLILGIEHTSDILSSFGFRSDTTEKEGK